MSDPPIRIAHLMRTASRSNAGVFVAASGLVRALATRGDLAPEVFAANDLNADADRRAWGGAPVHALRPMPPQTFSYTPALRAALRAFAPDIVHVHGLWLHNSIAARTNARRHASRTVVSIHGMLTPWALAHSRARKRIALSLYERANLAAAACLHALTPTEAAEVRALGFTNPICIVANGIDIPEPGLIATARAAPRETRELLFLGRLHPKKGIPELLRGWALFKASGDAAAATWRLNIAGWGEAEYQQELARLTAALGVGGSVTFSGPKHGDDLWRTYATADAFVLTSHSEAMPMAILEAWAAELPVIMTKECGLPEGVACGAATTTTREPMAIAAAIATTTAMTDNGRRTMGVAGRRLVAKHYSWQRAAQSFAEVYGWLAKGGTKPACVDVLP